MEEIEEMDIWGHNDEPPVMRDIVSFYTVESSSRVLAFMIFIRDGGVRKDCEIQEIVCISTSWNGSTSYFRKRRLLAILVILCSAKACKWALGLPETH